MVSKTVKKVRKEDSNVSSPIAQSSVSPSSNGNSVMSNGSSNDNAVYGVLDNSPDGHGLLRPKFSPSDRDVYISSVQARRLGLRPGDYVEGEARRPKENERYWGLLKITKVNGGSPKDLRNRIKFHNLTSIYPTEQFVLETSKDVLSTRLVDIVAPVGRGQRGMIVSPPKAGKTTIMKDIVTGIAANYPDVHVMAVLIGERPEEVTDIRRHRKSD